MKKTPRQGFTLIELSIVLVIIGLIVGGVLVGQDLIRAAKLRSIVTEKQLFDTAANAFKFKFNVLPGDMKNATDFWPTKSNCVIDTDPTKTCNGNGDGQIEYASESYKFWQHLALAGLLADAYTGAWGPGGIYDRIGGVNVPSSKEGRSKWAISWYGALSGDPTIWIGGNYGNGLTFQQETGAANTGDNEPLSPVEARQIDVKVDDGLPTHGRLWAYLHSGCIIPNGVVNPYPNAVYNVSVDGGKCALVWVKAYVR